MKKAKNIYDLYNQFDFTQDYNNSLIDINHKSVNFFLKLILNKIDDDYLDKIITNEAIYNLSIIGSDIGYIELYKLIQEMCVIHFDKRYRFILDNNDVVSVYNKLYNPQGKKNEK